MKLKRFLKLFLFSLSILIISVIVLIFMWKTYGLVSECKKVGEQIPSNSFDNKDQCCAGLTLIEPAHLDVEANMCWVTEDVRICANCGNEICDGPENRCNCPDDCGQP